jgi:hypothetical protein
MDKRIFHVTIKGLFFRPAPPSTSALLLIRERSGNWELPGGRLEHGEDFHAALRREGVALPHLDFTRTDECAEWGFFAASDASGLKLSQQLRPLVRYFSALAH